MEYEISRSDSESELESVEGTFDDDQADERLVRKALEKVVDDTKSHGISSDEFCQLHDLVLSFQDIFRIKLRCSDGLADVPPYHVDLKPDASNFRLPNRSYSVKSSAFLKWKMNRLVEGRRQFRNPTARYAAPALVVKKRHPALDITTDFRMTGDYKLINQYSQLWPMPTVEKLGEGLASCRFFLVHLIWWMAIFNFHVLKPQAIFCLWSLRMAYMPLMSSLRVL